MNQIKRLNKVNLVSFLNVKQPAKLSIWIVKQVTIREGILRRYLYTSFFIDFLFEISLLDNDYL